MGARFEVSRLETALDNAIGSDVWARGKTLAKSKILKAVGSGTIRVDVQRDYVSISSLAGSWCFTPRPLTA